MYFIRSPDKPFTEIHSSVIRSFLKNDFREGILYVEKVGKNDARCHGIMHHCEYDDI